MEKVMRRAGEYVIPHEAIPEVMSRISVYPEDKFVCVERTEAMFTTYWASAGEVSPFFLAVMKEKKIIGSRCPKCKMVICPPYMTRCPVCQNDDFSLVSLETGIEMPQVGYMLGTPPITVFANARFARYAPFGRG
ncbi:MAG: zinc ribbon domain-containing protein, partial [Thermodesulfobacteriota bacterium]